MSKTNVKKSINKKSLIFYISFMAWPVLQFAVFYIAVNFNSFLLAFKEINPIDNSFIWTTKNFSFWLEDVTTNAQIKAALGVSFKGYGINLIVGLPMGLIFSYYIFKRLPGAMGFRFMLFLPSIVSALVLVLIYSYFVASPLKKICEELIPGYVYDTNKWISPSGVSFPVLMFYNILVGFGTSVLLYSNKMSSISPELVEAAELDGVNTFNEFIHVVMPHVYPTLSVFLITGVAGIFINQFNAFPLTNGMIDKRVTSVGYIMYKNVLDAKGVLSDAKLGQTAALGLVITAVVIPLTFLVRFLLEKLGPSEE